MLDENIFLIETFMWIFVSVSNTQKMKNAQNVERKPFFAAYFKQLTLAIWLPDASTAFPLSAENRT